MSYNNITSYLMLNFETLDGIYSREQIREQLGDGYDRTAVNKRQIYTIFVFGFLFWTVYCYKACRRDLINTW